MKGLPEISVVMANYNGRRYLEPAIKSLQNQTFRSWELILVDDASDDDSAALAEKMGQDDPRIRVVRQPSNQGPAAARNRALQLARGQWISVFDNDDIMLPPRLETLRSRARDDKALIVADNMLVFSEKSPVARPFLGPSMTMAPHWITLAEFIDSNRLHARLPNLGYLKPLINVEMLKSSGIAYNERLRIGEDYEFMARLLAHGPKLRFEPSANYLYRKHTGSISHRIRGQEILALIEADEQLAKSVRPLSGEETIALAKRRKTLDSMLLYDEVVNLIKAGQYRRAAALSIAAPHIWPLLTEPVAVRVARLARTKQGAIPAPQIFSLGR